MTKELNKIHKKSCVNCHFLQKNCTVIEERLQPDTDWGKEDREEVPPSLAKHYPSCFMGEWNPFLEGKRYSAEELVEVAAQTNRKNCRYFESWQPGVSKTSVKRSRQEKLEANRSKKIMRRSIHSILLAYIIILLSILKETWLGSFLFQWLDVFLCWSGFFQNSSNICR